jgi:hypothetical protein
VSAENATVRSGFFGIRKVVPPVDITFAVTCDRDDPSVASITLELGEERATLSIGVAEELIKQLRDAIDFCVCCALSDEECMTSESTNGR